MRLCCALCFVLQGASAKEKLTAIRRPCRTAGRRKRKPILYRSPVVSAKKGMHEKVFEDAAKSGYVRVRVDGSMYDLSEKIELDKNIKHSIDIVVDRLVMQKETIGTRLTDSIETAASLSGDAFENEPPRSRETDIATADQQSAPPSRHLAICRCLSLDCKAVALRSHKIHASSK